MKLTKRELAILALSGGVDGSSVYTKEEVDASLLLKANIIPQNPQELYVNYQIGLSTNAGTVIAPLNNLTNAVAVAIDSSIIRIGNGEENNLTLSIPQNGITLKGNSDNINYNSITGKGLTSLTGAGLTFTSSANLENIHFINSTFEVSTNLTFTNCHIEGNLQILGNNSIVVFDNCYFNNISTTLLSFPLSSNSLIVFPNCTGAYVVSTNPEWTVSERTATEERDGLMSKKDKLALIFTATDIKVVSTSYPTPPTPPFNDTDVDFIFDNNNFVCQNFHKTVVTYCFDAGQALSLPNYEITLDEAIEQDGNVIKILNHASSTESLKIIAQNGRKIKTETGDILDEYSINGGITAEFRWNNNYLTWELK